MQLITNNYILIKILEPAKETQGGLALPDQAIKKGQWGHVISVGEGLSDMTGKVLKPDIDPGDLVYFTQHGPEKLDYSPEGLGILHLISEGDIYVKVKVAADNDVSLIPMGNYIHVQPLDDSVQRQTVGGIYLPDQVVERPTKAKVIAVGPGQRTTGGFHPPAVMPGDIVRYRPYSTFEIRFDDLGIKEAKTHIVAYGDIVLRETEGYIDYIKEQLNRYVEK